MSFRIFVTGSGLVPEAQQFLIDEGCVIEVGRPEDTVDDLIRKLGNFNPDGLIVRQGKITADVQAAAAKLRVICKHGVGVENIDIEAASRKGIPVMYTPGANTESVAEHTLALMLALLRRVPREDLAVKTGRFEKSGYDGQELFGRTLGIIGFGRIGRRLSELVAPFRMIVLAYDPIFPVGTLPPYIRRVRGIHELLALSDIISLHCPLTPDTQGLVDKAAMARMKKGAYLINTARGGLLDEDGLLRALRDRRIAGAALDVFEAEPLRPDHPLCRIENVILTPHVGGLSDRALKNMGLESAGNVLAALRGQPLDPGSLLNGDAARRSL